MVTQRIRDFLSTHRPDGPCLVVDLDIVHENYLNFEKALPQSRIFYAVKANPAPEILRLLVSLGSSFDVASVSEIRMVLEAGATVERISFGNTIKKERDIAYAHALGVSLYAVDCIEEVEKVARAAPGARVFCRVLTDGEGAEWPLSRKFGCVPAMAVNVLRRAHQLGLQAYGVSFHVGSQQTNPNAWDRALSDVAMVFEHLEKEGIQLKLINMGGGFPTRYLYDVPTPQVYGMAIFDSLKKYFGNRIPETIIEPGRAMVGNAGVIRTEVILISKKADNDNVRWVYLDVGKFNGLVETMDEAIRYPIETVHDDQAVEPCILAGPTCDSADIMYEKAPYLLPLSLTVGDELLIHGTGAYTATYASVAFNGFEPLRSYVI
ncbi:type III PLP-dependent enzyme [Bartonella ancashensis]|uniref:ornithine decarboxylase n=1 Tax=Bartonella ancashensis TaxID=1318743 RepID=A0A0M4M4S1_9HYPH|nr:type III PLP-dependent enzyme [Bartonella ancashensis]ALE02917.1 Ornithine decarboxylase [Bartonella ancashensis]